MNDKVALAKFFDYTNLKNNLSFTEVERFCREAIEYGFYAVCIQPFYVPFAVQTLKNSTVRVVSVVDFPYGCSQIKTKLQAVEEMAKVKVEEIDFVMNIPAFVNNNAKLVEDEIVKSLELCRSNNVRLKVIIETGLLLPEEIANATRLLCEVGVDYIKTSTGVVARGATYEDIKIIKENLSGNTKIKASGGIRSLEQVLKFLELGVSRIGTSSATQIIKELESKIETE
ncbi:MAG: deoxyribose-phosphate aldolase [Candidatus Kapaibacteriota bacterium]